MITDLLFEVLTNPTMIPIIVAAINDIIDNSELLKKYDINENSEWQLKDKRKGEFEINKVIKIDYRPFEQQGHKERFRHHAYKVGYSNDAGKSIEVC